MPILTQFYASKQGALDAVSELKRRGLRDKAFEIIDRLDHGGEARLRRRGVRGENATGYAARVRSGQTLLIVEAPVMSVFLAQAILDRPRPQPAPVMAAMDGEVTQKPPEEAPLSPAHYEGGTASDAAPFSAALGLPVLSRHDPAPLSSALGLPVLLREKASGRKPLLNNFFPGKIFGPLLTKTGEPITPGTLIGSGRPSTPDTLIKSGRPSTPFTLIKSGKPTTPFTLIKSGKPLGFGIPLLLRDR